MTSSAKKVPRYQPAASRDRVASLPEEHKQKGRALVKPTPTPPKELAGFFADPPLVGEESREDYENLLSAVAAAAKPADAIAWIYVRDFVDLTWEKRRAEWLKRRIIEAAQEAEVRRIMMPPPISQFQFDAYELENDPDRISEIETVEEELKQWASDPEARRRIDKQLASEGYDATYILTQALTDRADEIDAIDKRISAIENRRIVVLREIDRHDESMARRLEKATPDIIDGEFTEAAE